MEIIGTSFGFSQNGCQNFPDKLSGSILGYLLSKNLIFAIWNLSKNDKLSGMSLVLGVNAFHRKEIRCPLREFVSRADRAYKLEIQIIASLIQDLQIGNLYDCLSKGGILRPVLS